MTMWLAAQAFGLALCLSNDGEAHAKLSGIGKMIASTAMVALAVQLKVLSGPVAWPMMLGLLLSWFGDLALIGKGERAIIGGIALFGLAHFAYAAASLQLGFAPVATLMTLTIFTFPAAWWLQRTRAKAGKLWPAVVGYAILVCTMAGLAVGAAAQGTAIAWGVGAVLFAISDVFVARRRFVSDSPWNRRIGLPVYYVAQLLMSVGAAIGHG